MSSGFSYQGNKLRPHLLDTLVEELKAGVSVTNKGALLDELSEHLSPRHLDVEFLLRPVTGLQETCRNRRPEQTIRLKTGRAVPLENTAEPGHLMVLDLPLRGLNSAELRNK